MSRAFRRGGSDGEGAFAEELTDAEALIQAARDEGADLILVGHTGSGYATRALLASTAANVLRHAPCDVLVVRVAVLRGTGAGSVERERRSSGHGKLGPCEHG